LAEKLAKGMAEIHDWRARTREGDAVCISSTSTLPRRYRRRHSRPGRGRLTRQRMIDVRNSEQGRNRRTRLSCPPPATVRTLPAAHTQATLRRLMDPLDDVMAVIRPPQQTRSGALTVSCWLRCINAAGRTGAGHRTSGWRFCVHPPSSSTSNTATRTATPVTCSLAALYLLGLFDDFRKLGIIDRTALACRIFRALARSRRHPKSRGPDPFLGLRALRGGRGPVGSLHSAPGQQEPTARRSHSGSLCQPREA
jgi:hypothetical protein